MRIGGGASIEIVIIFPRFIIILPFIHAFGEVLENSIYIYISVHRGSYVNAHVLFNLLNVMGKRDKMRGFPSILSLFGNESNRFNNTGARMLDSIYHITLKAFCNHIFGVKTLGFCHMRNFMTFPENL